MTVRCIFTTEMLDVTGDGYRTIGDFYKGKGENEAYLCAQQFSSGIVSLVLLKVACVLTQEKILI